MTGTITPKGWDGFQHYKDRKPLWIKLHRDLLDNYEFHCLPVASKALAPCLWLLASEYDGGAIPLDFALIAFRLRMTAADVEQAIKPLISTGFFVASSPLAECKQVACLETERETETDERKKPPRAKRSVGVEFDAFWSAYPRKVAKAEAEKAWLKVNPDQPLVTEIMAGLSVACRSTSWNKDGGQFIPHPATWLNAGRWEDQPVEVPPRGIGARSHWQDYCPHSPTCQNATNCQTQSILDADRARREAPV